MESLSQFSPKARKAFIDLIDRRIKEKLKDRLPNREDFSELKLIVQELAQAQVRTEKRVEELAKAQKRTEIQVQNLARNVGKLSDNVGFGLEDIAHVVLPGYLERNLNIQVKAFSRKFFNVNHYEVEINLYAVGKKSGKRITVLGEYESRIYRREVNTFIRQAEKVRDLLKGNIQLVMFGYWIHPSATGLAEEENVHLVASYQR